MRETLPGAADFAWAAGLFEGEGCVSIPRRASGPGVPTLIVQMTDPDVLVRLVAVLGGNVRPQKSAHKPVHRWTLCRASDVERALEGMLPWLGTRRASKAREALDVIRSRAVAPAHG